MRKTSFEVGFHFCGRQGPAYRYGRLTSYGIDKAVQKHIASMRTDLDSFSEVEAYALMTSGYRMTEQAFRSKAVDGFPEPTSPFVWKFLAVEDGMKGRGGSNRYLILLLDISRHRAFKVWSLYPRLKYTAMILPVGLATLLGSTYSRWRDLLVFQVSLGTVLTILAVVALDAAAASLLSATAAAVARKIFAKKAVRAVPFPESAARIGFGFAMITIGWLAARIHLHFFDKLFLRLGSVEYLKQQNDA